MIQEFTNGSVLDPYVHHYELGVILNVFYMSILCLSNNDVAFKIII
jgi:hypothetical protein